MFYQNYNPLHFLPASALLAALPILFFVIVLIVLRWKMSKAAAGVLLLALLIATTVFGMPLLTAASATLYGFCYGLFPIGWIVLNVVFLYRLTVKSGAFNTVRASIASITPDARLQLILIGFAFSAFLEGAAGYGTPVAITAALLVGLGFAPLRAAMLCMIANTAPVAFGAMGTSLIVASQVSHVDLFRLGQIAGTQLPVLSLFALVWIVVALAGWRRTLEILPALIVAGISFAGTMVLTARLLGPQLPAITSGLATMVALTLFLRFWQPKQLMTLNEHRHIYPDILDTPPLNFKNIMRAWLPYLLLTSMVVLWSSNAFQSLFTKGGLLAFSTFTIEMPYLHLMVVQTAPLVTSDTSRDAIFKFDLIAAIGSSIFLAAVLAAFLLRVKAREVVSLYSGTCKSMAPMVLNIGLILAFAMVSNYSGMSSTLALLLAKTGDLYPLVSPLLGWFGVFLTGSDTSSNALFAPLQAAVAGQIGVSDTLLVAANSLGGAAGKMISPQSIAVACAAVGLLGREGDLMNATFKASLAFALGSAVAIFVLSLLM